MHDIETRRSCPMAVHNADAAETARHASWLVLRNASETTQLPWEPARGDFATERCKLIPCSERHGSVW